MIGTAGAPKHDYLRELGAQPTTYGPGLADRVAALTSRGVDAVIDAAASGSLPDLIAIAGPDRRIVTVADRVLGPVHGVTHVSAPNHSDILAEGATLRSLGEYSPSLAEVFTLDQIAMAHSSSETGRTRGKIAVTVNHLD